ncbi:hypothetical protein AB0J38_27315 [Streptomyces sp. NPDC050095]|uniref:hypothetical protein n=1 Tax=unclassified Streptomyces TaxID=2593676 RepID=UPI0034291AA3
MSSDLTGYAALLHRACGDFGSAQAYLNGNTAVDPACSADLWDSIFSDHTQNVQNAKEVIARFETILAASQQELRKTATWYESVDLEQARRIDATYPTTKGPLPVPRSRPTTDPTFRDARDAVSRLKPAGSANGWLQGHLDELRFAPINKTAGTLFDIASPSTLVNEGLKLAFDHDILGSLSNRLAGDWQTYAGCADAWHCLGDFFSDSAANIRHGNDVLGITWQGNAADAARKYFEKLATNLDSAKDCFHALRDHYQGIATTVFAFADLVKGGLAYIFDTALQAALAAAASAAAATTGVGIFGTFVGAAVVAQRVSAMLERYGEILKQYEKLLLYVTMTTGAAGGVTAKVTQDLKKFPVVGRPYDNAIV